VVYRAHDRTLDRTVALKFLHEKFLESLSGKARFLQEARAVSRLSHPHIAIIYSIEESNGEIFLVFEYLPGGALRSLLGSLKADGKRLSAEQAATCGLQIAEGLAHAHASGIIHRDVKPGNVMFARDGSLKLVDFGLSKLHGSDTLTMSGRVIGTPQYMSPEQAQGNEIDERSDIFSLGVVLYEMVAGQPPFSADRGEAVIHQIVHEPAAPVPEKNPECPLQLAEVIHRALNKNREARYQRMLDLTTDLRAFLRAFPAASEIRTPTMVTSRLALRRWTIVAVLSLVMVVSALFLTPLRTWLWQPLPAEKQLAILPFVNEENDPASQAFGDGLMQSAIAALQDLQPSLVVTPAGEIRRLAIKSPEEIGAWVDRAPLTIWMDGRPHPSKYAEHTRAGFTTGTWEGNTLVSYTTHMKAGFLRKTGARSSEEAAMTMRFYRHGDILTVLAIIDDPIYLPKHGSCPEAFNLAQRLCRSRAAVHQRL